MTDEFKPVTDVSDYSDNSLGDLIENNRSNQEVIVTEPDIDQYEADFGLSRDTITEILEKAPSVIDGMQKIAEQSDSPRAYEVLASMMEKMVTSSEKLVELYEKKAKIDAARNNGEAPKVQNNTQNNIVFSGSNEELLDAVQKAIGNDSQS